MKYMYRHQHYNFFFRSSISIKKHLSNACSMTLHKVSFKLDLYGEFFFSLFLSLVAFSRKARDFYFISKHLFSFNSHLIPFKYSWCVFFVVQFKYSFNFSFFITNDISFDMLKRPESKFICLENGIYKMRHNIFYHKVCIFAINQTTNSAVYFYFTYYIDWSQIINTIHDTC